MLSRKKEVFDADGSDGMKGKISSLCRLMREETGQCRELLKLAKSEQDLLMGNDIDGLSRNTELMNENIRTLKSCQISRRRLIREIGGDLGIEPQAISIGTIGKEVDTDLLEELEKTSKDLVETGEKLYRVNHNTIYLIGFSLDLLEQQSRLWTEIATEEEGYCEEGKRVKGSASPLFIEKKA